MDSLALNREINLVDKMVMPVTNPALTEDRILILTPDGSIRSVPLPTEGISVGSVDDNTLLLDYEKVSAYHAKISRNGQNYYVTDLDSIYGSFLGNQRLPKRQAMVWNPDQVLRIGNNWLRLEQNQNLSDSALFKSGKALLNGHSGFNSDIKAYIEASQLMIEPGSQAVAWVIVRNTGSSTENINLSVGRPTEKWIHIDCPVINLEPNTEKEIKLLITPPRQTSVQAGNYDLKIRLTSANKRKPVVEVSRKLKICAYSQFKSSFNPNLIKPNQSCQVIIENQGNVPETFNLTWQDSKKDLVFEPKQSMVHISAGQTGEVQFRVVLRKRQWWGKSKTHPFKVTVRASNGKVYSTYGEVISQPIFSRP